MHAVEGVVSQRARQRLKHAIFNSLDDGRAAVDASIAHHNAPNAHEAPMGARPCRWRRDPDDRVASSQRGHRRLEGNHASV